VAALDLQLGAAMGQRAEAEAEAEGLRAELLEVRAEVVVHQAALKQRNAELRQLQQLQVDIQAALCAENDRVWSLGGRRMSEEGLMTERDEARAQLEAAVSMSGQQAVVPGDCAAGLVEQGAQESALTSELEQQLFVPKRKQFKPLQEQTFVVASLEAQPEAYQQAKVVDRDLEPERLRSQGLAAQVASLQTQLEQSSTTIANLEEAMVRLRTVAVKYEADAMEQEVEVWCRDKRLANLQEQLDNFKASMGQSTCAARTLAAGQSSQLGRPASPDSVAFAIPFQVAVAWGSSIAGVVELQSVRRPHKSYSRHELVAALQSGEETGGQQIVPKAAGQLLLRKSGSWAVDGSASVEVKSHILLYACKCMKLFSV